MFIYIKDATKFEHIFCTPEEMHFKIWKRKSLMEGLCFEPFLQYREIDPILQCAYLKRLSILSPLIIYVTSRHKLLF